MAFEGESSDRVLETIVGDFPTLIFVELVSNSNKGSVGVGQVVYFDDFSEDPAFVLMIAVDDHVFFQLIFVDILVVAEVSTNKVIKVVYQLKSK